MLYCGKLPCHNVSRNGLISTFLVLYDTATLLKMLCTVCCRSVCALPDVRDTAMFLKMLFVVCYVLFVTFSTSALPVKCNNAHSNR